MLDLAITACPWCGNSDAKTEEYNLPRRPAEHYVHCDYCGMRGPSRTTQDDAVRAWGQIGEWKKNWIAE